MKKIFSFPLYVGISESGFEEFKTFLKKYADYIYDVYFSHKILPFTEDAIGGIRQSSESWSTVYNDLDKILSIQKETGVTVSATFNNVFIASSDENLDIFIKEFAPLYESGIKSVTLPFPSWVYSGKIKKAYPDLYIKNTFLNKVHTAREIWNLAEIGFDYINIDRILFRDRESLLEIGKARDRYYKKTGKYINLSVLANMFPCQGHCPFQDEHYGLASRHQHTMHHFPSLQNPCLYSHMTKNRLQEELNFFKLSAVPPFREDSDALLEVVDVYKLFGRILEPFFEKSMALVSDYAEGKAFFHPVGQILEKLRDEQNEKKLVETWKEKIKNCNFTCYSCNICDRLLEKLNEEQKQVLRKTMILY